VTDTRQAGEPDSKSLAELYREVVLAHAARPVGYQAEIDATHTAEGSNPLCGDHVTLQLEVSGGQVRAAAFSGESCAICTASVSLLCEQLPGRSVKEAGALAARFESAITGNGDQACPDFLKPMLGVRQYPARLQCALLPWRTAQDALHL
jgi:nitrogen fixation protein NifU and related proteins